jgi:hypothetical protein
MDCSIRITLMVLLISTFMTQPEKSSIKNDVWFQQDGALTNYTLAVREYLPEVFSDCYFTVSHLYRPIHLHGHLNTQIRHCVIIHYWGFTKGNVVQQLYHVLEDIQQPARLLFKRVTPQVLRKMARRIWRRPVICHEKDGAQTNLLKNLKFVTRNESSAVVRGITFITNMTISAEVVRYCCHRVG